MIFNYLKRKIRLIANIAGLFFIATVAHPFFEEQSDEDLKWIGKPSEEDSTIFGQSFTSTGQLDIYKLFLAMLELNQKTQEGHNLMLLTHSSYGLGDYSYLDKTARNLLNANPSLDIGVTIGSNGRVETQVDTIKAVFSNINYPRYWLKGGSHDEADTARIALEKSKFTLMLASRIPVALKSLKENNAFFIAEVIHSIDSLATCADPECRAEQLRWSFRKYVADYLDYTVNILDTATEKFNTKAKQSEDDDLLETFNLAESLHHQGFIESENLSDLAPVFFKPWYRFTDYSKRVIGKGEYCKVETKLFFCEHIPRFGLSPINAGILIDTDLLEKVSEFRQASEPENSTLFSGLDSVPAGLKASISGSNIHDEQAAYFLGGGNYYFGYFHNRNGKIGFIRALADAHPEEVIRVVLPCDINCIRDDLNRDGLIKGNITKVRFWNPDAGWVTIKLSEEPGRTIEIIDLPKLPNNAMQSLAFFSKSIVGTTGDQSLFEALTMGKLPFHEVVSHQFLVRHQLGLLADYSLIKDFFNTLDPRILGPVIRQLEASPEKIADYTKELITRKSANGLIQSIADTALSPSSEIESFLINVDTILPLPDDDQDLFLSQLDSEQSDIALARLVIKTMQKKDRNDLDTSRLGERIGRIKSYLIQALLTEALFEKTQGQWKPD